MSSDALSQTLFLVCFVIYALSWVFYVRYFGKPEPATERKAVRVLWAGFILEFLALVHRWAIAGHAPWANQYEAANFVAFGAVGLFLLFQYRNRVPSLGVFVVPVPMLALVAAALLPEAYKHTEPLVPALRSYWLKIHVSCMLISYGSFAVTFACSLMYLIRDGVWTKRSSHVASAIFGACVGCFFAYVHSTASDAAWMKWSGWIHGLGLGTGSTWPILMAGLAGGLLLWALAYFGLKPVPAEWVERLPDREVLDELNYKSVAVGVPLLTLGIILGAMWGYVAWGHYWSWDPKETWALITWLIFVAYLHMRIFMGWQGRRLAWIGLLGAGSVIFTFWGVNFLLSGLHAYAK